MGTRRSICWIILISAFFPTTLSQIYPGSYEVSSNVVSESGSSKTGLCSSVTDSDRVCNSPRSSVLFDDKYTLTELDGDMWARQLLTFNTSTSSANITFNFTNASDMNGPTVYTGVSTIEVVMYNCPIRGIGTGTNNIDVFNVEGTIGTVIPNESSVSCDYLVRVCDDSLLTTAPIITFNFNMNHQRIYVAEITFYSGLNRKCSAVGTIPTSVMAITKPGTTTTPGKFSTEITSVEDVVTSVIIASMPASSNSAPNGTTIENSSATLVTIAVVTVMTGVLFIAVIVVIVVIAVMVVRRKKKMNYNITDSFVEQATNNSPNKCFYTQELIQDYEELDNFYDMVATLSNKTTANQNSTPMYEEVELGKKKAKSTVDTSDYEDMDELVSSNSKFAKSGMRNASSGGVDKTATDKDSHMCSFLDHSTGIEQSRKKPLKTSISTLDPGTISSTDKRSRSAIAPEMYATVKKPPPKLVQCEELANKQAPESTSETSFVPCPKTLCYNTHGKPSDEPTHPPPPEIPEKSHELVIYLETKVTKPESGGREFSSGATMNTDNIYSEPDIQQPSSAVPESSPVENIYESIYSESLNPSLFKEKPDESRETVAADDLCPYSSIYAVPTVSAPMEKPLEITEKNIKEEKKLGSGQFGMVILAKTVGLSLEDLKIGTSTDKSVSISVAVKKLKSDANQSVKEQFEKEYRFMFQLKHPNVIRMLGICTEGTPFIMMEYMEKGDLNQLLQHQYNSIIDNSAMPGDGEITLKTLVYICTQIASGMNYLAVNNFVHRDVATRNCLVGEDFLVKIADFGMSRSLYDSHYYIIKGKAILPVRWMACECFYGKFSTKTDVWAFGCTMWEVFQLCKHKPYYEMNDQEVVKNAVLAAGRSLLSCPEKCPECVYEIMKLCWTHEASKRATFEELLAKLSSL